MDHFQYKNGELYAEGVALSKIAEEVGTPFYVYSQATLERHYQVFAEAVKDLDTTICFAVKANSNLAVIKTLADQGAGADVVSVGELKRAIKAGVPADKIVFSGVGKSRSDLAYAVKTGIRQINVESEEELVVLSEVATELDARMPIVLRVNPDVDAKTHEKISTGKSDNKFGIDWTRAVEVYQRAANMSGVDPRGLACHIGSQLVDLEPFRQAFRRMKEMVGELRGLGLDVSRVDLGGGLGIPYEEVETPLPVEYGKLVVEELGDLDVEFEFEPGRMIAGNAGLLVSEVLYVKEAPKKTFAVIDAAMNDLMRPSLYSAYHAIVPLVEAEGEDTVTYDVVGPICETGDTFAKDRELPALVSGDLVAFRTAGAYGATMSNTYNSRALIPEVMVRGDDYAVIRKRVDIEEQMDLESLANWQG
ncbi:diaminopimelate decarboxylase [Terasakiella sp. A23]|uniref:diaminopimelate decarboxylase n=1 Tax=Terasakiella sp. FCG-A23 TaxID=3080561 RepID=UPI002955CB00|nr:diaminopimelate decarboxylase [Terasakiella sp. A23]MDV7338179.1 diaminopimelate decarboxylase [Terasakiella sp. A23]